MKAWLMVALVFLLLLPYGCDAGIPGLGHFLISAFPGAITKDTLKKRPGISIPDSFNGVDPSASTLRDDVDCLCVDMNEVVHSSVHGQGEWTIDIGTLHLL
jgi:hypothetical protein